MKRINSLLSLLIVLVLILGMPSFAFADDNSATDLGYYRIRVYGGRVAPGLVYDELIDRSANVISLAEDIGVGSKVTFGKKSYYVKDVLRESGKERPEAVERDQLYNVPIDKDRDYVRVYEVLRNQAVYYVDYLDASGNELRPRSVPRYANVGDIVYVAALEIPGYTPDARFRTNTDGITDGYVFTFHYTRTPTTTGGGTTTTTTTGGGGGGGGAVAGGAAANGNANNAANNAANNPNANNQNPNNPDNPVNNPNNETQPVTPAAPLDIIDEAEVPLAAPDFGMVGTAKVPSAPKVIEPTQSNRIPNWALIAGTVVLIGLIAMLYWYLLFYRKKKKYASINDDYEILGFDNDDDF